VRTRSLAALALAVTPLCFGYNQLSFSYGDGTVALSHRIDNAAIQFYVNDKVVAGYTSSSGKVVISAGSDPVAAIRSALEIWNTVSGAKLKFLPLKTTSKVNDPLDNQMTVVVGSTADDISAIGSAVAITATQSGLFSPGDPSSAGVIADTDILLNPAINFSTDFSTTTDLQGVMTHELGHALGMNHSGLLGAVMFQFAGFTQRYLSPDETGFAATIYPAATAGTGKLTGKVLMSDGSPVQSGLVVLTDPDSGAALTALTGQDGVFSTGALPGNYIVYAEPLGGAGNIVGPGNLYLTTAVKVSSGFQSTVLGGAAQPTRIAVQAGATAQVPNLTVTSGASSLTLPFVGVGSAGGSGDANNVASGSAAVVSSGRAVDLVIGGGGFDGTITATVIGRGATVRAGSIRTDSKLNLNGAPVVRITLDLAAQSAPAIASLLVTKGSSVLTVSGLIVLVPPTPTFVTQGVDSAASAIYLGEVSPGGLSSIYVSGGSALGPAAPVLNAGYDGYNKLATSLGGVTVTFDGVPAPLVFVSAGQINLQVPFEVAGKTTTRVVVNYNGSTSPPISVPVKAAEPAFFMLNATDPFAANADYAANPKVNSSSNPAARGTVISVYGTGVGQPSYTIGTGNPAPGPPAGFTGNHSCTLGTQTISVPFAGWTPTAVGLAQWSFVIPSDAATGAVSLKCTDKTSGASTQSATIYIK
jgi:uncharacterized protein (TIGR03437 family)